MPHCNSTQAFTKTLLAVILALPLSQFTAMPQPSTPIADQPGLLKSEFIYEKAPFPECHASTIAETKDGLIAAWFGGTRERNPDVCIWTSRFLSGHWTPPSQA